MTGLCFDLSELWVRFRVVLITALTWFVTNSTGTCFLNPQCQTRFALAAMVVP